MLDIDWMCKRNICWRIDLTEIKKHIYLLNSCLNLQKYRERVITSRCQLLDKLRHIEHVEVCNAASNNDYHLDFTLQKQSTIEELLQNNEDLNIDEELLVESILEEELTQYGMFLTFILAI